MNAWRKAEDPDPTHPASLQQLWLGEAALCLNLPVWSSGKALELFTSNLFPLRMDTNLSAHTGKFLTLE